MDDLISRQAAIDALSMMQGIVAENGVRKGISMAWQQIKDLPSAQRTGQWINKKPRWIASISMTVHDAYECSNCGEPGVNWWKHCIYCGSPMEIEEWKIPIIERWRNERSD